MPNTKNVPPRARFWYSRGEGRTRTCGTPETRCFWCSAQRGRGGDASDTKTHKGVFWCSRGRGGGADASDIKNMPVWGVFLVFETRGRRGRGEEEGDAPDTKTCPTRACFGVRHEGEGWGRIGHQNAPHKGAFRCSRRGEEEGEGKAGDALNTKTRPTRAHFGVWRAGKGHGWGGRGLLGRREGERRGRRVFGSVGSKSVKEN